MGTTRSRMRSRLAATVTLAAFACLTTIDLPAQEGASGRDDRVIRIAKQGSFYYGGRKITAPDTFEPTQPFGDNSGEIFDVDKGYAFFQIPPNARQYPLVMWHGGGQHGKTYEDFEDRENYQSIFLRRGWSVYIIDQPRTGKAGYPSFTGPFGTLEGEEIIPNNTLAYGIKVGFNNFRLGVWGSTGGGPWRGRWRPSIDGDCLDSTSGTPRIVEARQREGRCRASLHLLARTSWEYTLEASAASLLGRRCPQRAAVRREPLSAPKGVGDGYTIMARQRTILRNLQLRFCVSLRSGTDGGRANQRVVHVCHGLPDRPRELRHGFP